MSIDFASIAEAHGSNVELVSKNLIKVGKNRILHIDKVTPRIALLLLGYSAEQVEQYDDDAFRKMNVVRVVEEGPANTSNRRIKGATLVTYALDILHGDWEDNSQTGTYTTRGHIVSLQHRLGAVLMANKIDLEEHRRQSAIDAAEEGDSPKPRKYAYPLSKRTPSIPLLIALDVVASDRVIDSVDIGEKRTGKDVTGRRLRGTMEYDSLKDEKRVMELVASAAKLVWTRAGGKAVADRTRFPVKEMTKFLEQHPRLSEMVEIIADLDNREDHGISQYPSIPQFAGICYLFTVSGTEVGAGELDYSRWDDAVEFAGELAIGADLPAGHPALVLAKAYTVAKVDRTKGIGRDRDWIVNVAAKAWNARVEGRTEGLKTNNITPNKDEEPRVGGIDLDLDTIRKLSTGDAEPAKPTKKKKRKARKVRTETTDSVDAADAADVDDVDDVDADGE